MRAAVVLATVFAITAHAGAIRQAEDPEFAWQAPDSSAKRSPCPMLNSLANHGYLDCSGNEISMQNLIDGLGKAINFDESLVRILGTPAFETSSTGNPDTFNLEDIAKHNVVEHDGSLSRADFAVTGDANTFNETVWGETRGYLESGATDGILDYKVMAAARSQRIATANATNPSFDLTTSQVSVSLAESALILGTLGGSFSAPAPPVEWMRIVFEEERLPFVEGFSSSPVPITINEILNLSQLIADSSA